MPQLFPTRKIEKHKNAILYRCTFGKAIHDIHLTIRVLDLKLNNINGGECNFFLPSNFLDGRNLIL